MNRMIINATHDEEWRIALANGQYLYDVIIQSTARIQTKGNVYKGKVIRTEPSLEAAFINYGAERHGFLPLKEVAYRYYKDKSLEHSKRLTISDVLEPGQELLVQINKEECGSKGAALTTSISLAGAYVVLSPNNVRASGISRHLDQAERKRLQKIRRALNVPEGMGLIIRTAGGNRSLEELQWDLEILLHLFDTIQQVSNDKSAPSLIYQESNVVIRALRDYLRKDIEEILVDNPVVYQKVIQHLGLIRPDFVSRVKLYQDLTPLFIHFQIENQIESAFHRKVHLPSGGSIVLDSTEALSSIDVNSAKSTKGKDIEDTALMTNLEAADEIARQLRLRDIGGLIIIDFIDMMQEQNRRKVEKRLRQALSMDRAHVNIDRILPDFGLLALSRERLASSLDESSHITCPQCLGQGSIRGVISLSLAIIRLIEEEALKENTAEVRAIVPISIAAYLLNEKRQTITAIEQRQNISIAIIPNLYLLVPQYKIERVRINDSSDKTAKVLSYQLTNDPTITSQSNTLATAIPNTKLLQEPAIKSLSIDTLSNNATFQSKSTPKAPKLLKKLLDFLFKKKEKPPVAIQTATQQTVEVDMITPPLKEAISESQPTKPPLKQKYHNKNHYRQHKQRKPHHRNENDAVEKTVEQDALAPKLSSPSPTIINQPTFKEMSAYESSMESKENNIMIPTETTTHQVTAITSTPAILSPPIPQKEPLHSPAPIVTKSNDIDNHNSGHPHSNAETTMRPQKRHALNKRYRSGHHNKPHTNRAITNYQPGNSTATQQHVEQKEEGMKTQHHHDMNQDEER